MKRMLITFVLCTAVMTGCTSPALTEDKKIALKKTLLIGLIPERNIFEQLERYEPLAAYLSEKTGVNIKLKVLTRYNNIIENFVSNDLDGAFFGSFTYTLAHAKLNVEPCARPVSLDGTSTYYGLIFVRTDSGIRTINDMKGKIFAFVDKATTAGYLLPLAFFKENNIPDYSTYFKETYFTGTHEDAVYDVLNKKANIGAAKNTVYYYLAAIDESIEKDLLILKRSPDVPENALALRKELDDTIKESLKEALLNMHNDDKGRRVLKNFRAKRFIETAGDDYSSVYNYIKEINLDLETYDYIN